jgi:hypothetical protein
VTDPKLARPLWRGRTNVDALTIACVEHAEEIGAARPFTHDFDVITGSYQPPEDDNPSGHTHDKGGAIDIAWCGHVTCVRNLRLAGMAAWHRTTAQGFTVDHIHAVVVDHPLLHPEAAAQVVLYRARMNGFPNPPLRGPDDGPRLTPIPRPVWPWTPQEEDMPLNDKDFEKITQLLDASIRAATPKIVDALLNASVDDDPETSVRRALRQAAQP